MGVNTTPQIQQSSTGTVTAEDVYKRALEAEGLVAADELVRTLRELHARTLTSGLVMRAYAAHRQAKNRAAQQATQQSAPKARA